MVEIPAQESPAPNSRASGADVLSCGSPTIGNCAPAVSFGRSAILYGAPADGAERDAYEAIIRTMAMDLARWDHLSAEHTPPSWASLEERDQIVYRARAELMFRLAGAAVAGIPL